MRPLDAKGRDDYFRRVADVLIAQIEAGTVPWVQSWQPGERAQPYNLKTDKSYRGGNATLLASVSQMRGCQDERWGTYRQIRESGGQVRRGQKGASIIYLQWEARRLARDSNGKPLFDDKSEPVYQVRPLERPRSYMYTVFNAEQASGLPPRPLRAPGHLWEQNERVERLMKNCGAEVEHTNQDRVLYDLGRDLIAMPHREQFPNPAGYYQSALHELGHWTGQPGRMNRESLVEGIRQGPKSLEYSREELRAEISSMITGDRLDVGHDGLRTAAYVGYWLRDHPQEIYLASRDAQGISDYLMERGRMLEQGREESVQDHQNGEPNVRQTNLGPDLSIDRERPPVEIPRSRPPAPAWPERAVGRERAMGPTR